MPGHVVSLGQDARGVGLEGQLQDLKALGAHALHAWHNRKDVACEGQAWNTASCLHQAPT